MQLSPNSYVIIRKLINTNRNIKGIFSLVNCQRILPTEIFPWYIPRKLLSRLIISPCCRFFRRCWIHRRCWSHQCCRIPHYPIMSFQHCFVKPWAIHCPIPQLSSAPCYASCCMLPHTHIANFRYCHTGCYPVATIHNAFVSLLPDKF
jgi:hypothetical protein